MLSGMCLPDDHHLFTALGGPNDHREDAPHFIMHYNLWYVNWVRFSRTIPSVQSILMLALNRGTLIRSTIQKKSLWFLTRLVR